MCGDAGPGRGPFLLAIPRFDEHTVAAYNGVWLGGAGGVVVGEPDERERYTNLRVEASRLVLPDGTEREVEGLVLVKAERYPARQYGDRLQVEGLLETPPVLEEFSYRDYLARQGIHSLLAYGRITLLAARQADPVLYALYAFKRYAQSTIARILPEPPASLLTGILLGVETGIPTRPEGSLCRYRHFSHRRHLGLQHHHHQRHVRRAGAAAVLHGDGRCGSRWRAWRSMQSSSGPLRRWCGPRSWASYTCGAATWGGRLLPPISLSATAIAMTAWNPYTLWDVGFQFSFAATLGLVLYAGPLERGFERALAHVTSAERAQKIVGLVNEALIVTLAAQITTTPLIL